MNNFTRKVGAVSVVSILGLAAMASTALAQSSYPDRAIRMIVPFSAGGGTDLGARLLADDLEEALGVSITVENVPGAGSQLGLTELANAEPDGYTIGALNQPAFDTIILSPERQAAFNVDSFDYIIGHVAEPLVIAVMPDSPYNSLADLVADARARSGELRVATSGLLTPEHLAQLQLEQVADTRLRIAHFNGAAESMTQFRGGRTDIAFTTPSFLEGLKPLAILTTERLAALPDIPTAVEQGFPELVMVSTRGFAAPAGLPDDVLDRLREAFSEVANTPEHQERAAASGLTVDVVAGDEYDAYVRQIHEAARPLVELSTQRQ
ncbi:Bug family tripartite tricarboxylate transporter substrate binding protein [Devosia naphthalenivorans]|uniref:Bug family tripartite tricarboxylate transporter substrate binding protein n=1 Tax=Devosia naphthalenivorans TaxID=2082392 RepID=UPI0013B05A25|nr:tripartite tricarboxylate transporter substrate binding protein [Devosia naphthalenivorans]